MLFHLVAGGREKRNEHLILTSTLILGEGGGARQKEDLTI